MTSQEIGEFPEDMETEDGPLPHEEVPDDVLDSPDAKAVTDPGDRQYLPDDHDILSSRIEAFMSRLYGSERYARHNDRILEYYDQYTGAKDRPESDADDESIDSDTDSDSIDRMAIILHDFVEHAILHPERTAERVGLAPEHAKDIRDNAVGVLIDTFNRVNDPGNLVKAYRFAIDASKWEAEARKWRPGATDKVDEMVTDGKMDEVSAVIRIAAINNDPRLKKLDSIQLERVLRLPEGLLSDLKLEEISKSTLDHNIKGLEIKAFETIVNIKHPPKGNPASTYRDCIEALNFFVPALMGLGYTQLAIDLRDVALQWFYDDPNGDARRQHTLSERYFDEIKEPVTGLLDAKFAGVETHIDARVKSEGSLRQKLAGKGYRGVRQAPDGVGFAFVVPDDMAGIEMSRFAQDYMDRLTADSRVTRGHPKPGELDFANMQGDDKKKSGYEAVHMTFYYHPYSDPDAAVPFEIQVLTREQHRLKIYGPFSDMIYKTSGSWLQEDEYLSEKPHLEHLEKRAQADRELSAGTTVQSIATSVAESPEFPDVYNELFRAVKINGATVLVPPELEAAVLELPPEIFGGEDELTVLPPRRLSEVQFRKAIGAFGSELMDDPKILNALEEVRTLEAGETRDDGVTPVFEGHILPTTLSAVMLAIQSGQIWSEEFSPLEHISNVVTEALLHDVVEKRMERVHDVNAKIAERENTLMEIKHRFGSTICAAVDALTVPVEIEDELERRDKYTGNILSNVDAQMIKPGDRLNNHIADIIQFATGEIDPSSPEGQKKLAYFAKTERHMSDYLSQLSGPYARAYDVVQAFGRHYGYTGIQQYQQR